MSLRNTCIYKYVVHSPTVSLWYNLVFLTAIKELPATMLLAPIGFSTLAMQIWQATENVDFADAAAASLAMVLVSMGSTLLVLSQENVKKEKVINKVEMQTKF